MSSVESLYIVITIILMMLERYYDRFFSTFPFLLYTELCIQARISLELYTCTSTTRPYATLSNLYNLFNVPMQFKYPTMKF